MPRFPAGQALLIDADDTLWENNIYFERAIAAFIGFLDHREYSPAEVRETLNSVERETILANGYGLTSFTRSLVECFERLSPAPATEEKRERIRGLARAIAEQEIELLPGVAETLADLATRHRLILMTKGNHAEQADKLARSGLARHFEAVEIVPEKDPAAYRGAIRRQNVAAGNAWMIGNSPKSDINPALAAGLHAVFLFHRDTWVLEHAQLNAAPPPASTSSSLSPSPACPISSDSSPPCRSTALGNRAAVTVAPQPPTIVELKGLVPAGDHGESECRSWRLFLACSPGPDFGIPSTLNVRREIEGA